MNDFKRQWEDISKDALTVFEQFGSSGWYILGQNVEAFERNLANYFGAKYAVGVANGLDAIEIALRSSGLKKGGLVLTTPNSAFATTLAIVRAGGIPYYVDTDQYGIIDLDMADKALSLNTNITHFVPVSLYGKSLDLNKLKQIKIKYGITLIEDCAQSIGVNTELAGDYATTSFYPTKNLGAFGDGGAVICNTEEDYQRIKIFRDYGQESKYNHITMGLNSRLDEVHAALLDKVLLPKLQKWTQTRCLIAERYLTEITNKHFYMIDKSSLKNSVWHLFPIFLNQAKDRNSFQNYLKENNIQSNIHYPIPITSQKAMKEVEYIVHSDLSQVQKVCETELSLPIHPYLNDIEVSRVISVVNSWRPS